MLKQIILAFACLCPMLAQSTPPDCSLQQGTFTAAGTVQFDNRSLGCDSWTVFYVADSGATLSLVFQSTNGQSAPGTWATYTGNTSNSSASFGTATLGIATYCGLASCVSSGGVTVETSWVRVSISSLSGGTLRVYFYGYRTGYGSGLSGGGGGGGGGGCANPCPVLGAITPGNAADNPVNTGTENDSGNLVADHNFPDQAAITGSSVTAIKLIAGSSGKLTYVGHLSMSLAAGTTLEIVQGTTTSTPCDTSQGALTGAYQNVVAVAFDWTRDDPLNTTVTGDDLCALFGGSTTLGGFAKYSQR